MGVENGLLPLKLNTGADGKELDRAILLLDTLSAHWKGSEHFKLHIVCRDDEFERICDALVDRSRNVNVKAYKESQFFDPDSSFHRTKPMYKQQLIKLICPGVLKLGAFVTFDADIVCIRDFDENTFVDNGSLISKWEPRGIHSWWANSMTTLGIWSDNTRPGIGVTPNILHSRLTDNVFDYFDLRGINGLDRLADYSNENPYLQKYEHEPGMPLTWSEYSLYNLAAEWSGMLLRYHCTPARVAFLNVHHHSSRSVWGSHEVNKLAPDAKDPAYFLIVQSWAGITTDEIRSRLLLNGQIGSGNKAC